MEEPVIKTDESTYNAVDAELEEFLSHQKATIKVVGSGGGGNNTVNRITEVGIAGAETIAVNTDAQDLLYTSADKKILIGKDVTRGLVVVLGVHDGNAGLQRIGALEDVEHLNGKRNARQREEPLLVSLQRVVDPRQPLFDFVVDICHVQCGGAAFIIERGRAGGKEFH